MTKYRCPNVGDCERANSGEIFEKSAGDELKCECGTLLELHPSEATGGPRGGGKLAPLALAAVAVLAVAGGGTWFALGRSDAPAAAVAATAPVAPAPVATGAPAVQPAAAAGSVMTALAPSEQELQKQKLAAQASLTAGEVNGAEASSTKAAANEMIKAGIAQMAQGKLADSERSFKSAMDIDPTQPLAYYNMAILRLRQDRTDDALKQFEASFMAGFSHYDKLEQDSDLAPVRSDKRFIELLARYRPAAK